VNSRLDGLQAAILRVKLKRLDDWNAARRRHAAQYYRLLAGNGIALPVVNPDTEPVWHLFVVRVPDRERLQARLKEKGIATGVHYPLPLHLQPAYKYLGMSEGALSVSEKVAQQIVSLPMYAELTDEMVQYVCACLREAMQRPA
jgi:dTDP-4-amino-4,6-dideoxygalactose transaminase